MVDDERIVKEGRSLQQAFDDIAEAHDLFGEYQELVSNPERTQKIHVFSRRADRSYNYDADGRKRTRQQYSEQAKSLQKRLSEIQAIFKDILKSKMISGELEVHGKPGDRYKPYIQISVSTVPDLRIKSWDKSTLMERGQPVLYDVKLLKKRCEAQPPGLIMSAIQVEELNHRIIRDGMSVIEVFAKIAMEHPLWKEYKKLDVPEIEGVRKKIFDVIRNIPKPPDVGNAVDDAAIQRDLKAFYDERIVFKGYEFEIDFNKILCDRLENGSLVGYACWNNTAVRYLEVPPELWREYQLHPWELTFSETRRPILSDEDEASRSILYAVRVFEKGNEPRLTNVVLPDTAIASQPSSASSSAVQEAIRPSSTLLAVSQEAVIPSESIVLDPNEPSPIPLQPRIDGKPALIAIINVARKYPDRFEWGLNQPKFAKKFAIEVAGPTGYGAETCRTQIRNNDNELRTAIKEAKSDD